MRICIFTSSRGVSLKKVSNDIRSAIVSVDRSITVSVFESPSINIDIIDSCDACIVVMAFDLTWAIPYFFIVYEFVARGKPAVFYATTEGRVPREMLSTWIIRDLSFVANSGYVRSKLEEVNARVVDVVPHGIDVDYIQRFRDLGNDVRESLGVGRKMLVGYIAQGHDRKCHNLFSEVVRATKARDPSIEFLVVTDSRGKSFYSNTDAIVMDVFGMLTDDQYYAYLHAIDVYAHGSCSEGFGIPVLEALACGKYVVHPSYDPLNEITTPEVSTRVRPHEIILAKIGGAGIVFELKRYKPDRFADAILSAKTSVYESDTRRREVENLAISRARQFDMHSLYPRFIDILNSVKTHRNIQTV